MKLLIPFFTALLLISCGSAKKTVSGNKSNINFNVTEETTDKTYGYTEGNPVKVGGAKEMSGPLNERKFLDALTGPNGETLSYERKGSCCPFKTKNGFMGGGMLDIYRVTWQGKGDTVSIYINMYDYEPLKIPVGFKGKN